MATAPSTILWIDDDRLLLSLGGDALAARGYRVLHAPDGSTGIEVARRERPDVVLLDVIMPEMQGFEVCQAFRADPALKDIPIILLTVLDDPSVSSLARKAGATMLLRKPHRLEEVVRAIEYVARRQP